MIEEFQEEQRKKAIRVRSFMDFTMGILLVIAGTCLLLFKVSRLEDLNRKLLGGLFILYGLWRVYRGYKKDYYR
jgi:hypothetical protein